MNRRLAAALVVLAAIGCGAANNAPLVITIPGTPPLRQHAKRPTLDAAALEDLKRPAIVAAGQPRLLGDGRVAAGEAFLELPVRHGVTGVLAGEVKMRGWLGGKSLAAGAPVFGIPMGGPDGPGLVWCAPSQAPNGGEWTSVCLPFGDKRHMWVTAKPALLPAAMTWYNGGGREAGAPQVTRQAVDFPPLTLSYAFAGVDSRGWARIATRADWGAGPQVIREIALPAGADGETAVRVLGGVVALKPDGATPASATVTLRAPLQPGAAIDY